MDEKKLKKQLIRVTAIITASSIVLCGIIFAILSYVFQAVHENDHIQMTAEVAEYRNRILKQLDKNLQILSTLSKAYEISGIMNSVKKLENSLIETNQANSFVSMAYFFQDGQGILNFTGDDTPKNYTLEDCSLHAQKAISLALQGENAVSKIFESQVRHEKVFVYSVPVYQNGTIVGALAASDTLEIFEDVVNGDTVMGGQGYIHLLGENGDFLVRSENTLVKEEITSIFDGPYLSQATKSAAHAALANRESLYGDFEYQGEKCHFYMEPMGFNGWYLFCANRLWDSIFSFGRILTIISGVFFFILIILLFSLYYGYYNFRKNSALLLQMAFFDSVTGAKNMIKFDQESDELRKKQKDFSIAALNIHNFKGINDLFGKAGGDKVLCYVKQVIEENLKDGEFFCRDAADQFYLLLLDTDQVTLHERLNHIIRRISTTTSKAQYGYEISLYAGVAIQGEREKALMALQHIQHTRHMDVAFYNSELHEALRRKNDIESYMNKALENKEFKLFLQPKNRLTDGSVIGAEALVRWQKPTGSYRYPNEFIPLFEANGFCVKLDLYMVERTCEQIRSWLDDGIEPIPISVNQSKLLFADHNYPDNLEQIVLRYQVPPALITLEILESIAMTDLEQINQQIEILHEKGFKVSMDDFGSGYSSLNMLYQMKIDELKLDRTFLGKVSNSGDEKRRKIILEQVIRFAQKLGMTTVAEGIETQQDKDNMASLGCDYGQGYFYERPISAKEFSDKYMFRR